MVSNNVLGAFVLLVLFSLTGIHSFKYEFVLPRDVTRTNHRYRVNSDKRYFYLFLSVVRAQPNVNLSSYDIKCV